MTRFTTFACAGVLLCAGPLAACGDDTTGADGTDSEHGSSGGSEGSGGTTTGVSTTADASSQGSSGDESTSESSSSSSGGGSSSSGGGSSSSDTGDPSACDFGHTVEVGDCELGWERWGLDSPLALDDLDGDGALELAAIRRDAADDNAIEVLSGADGSTLAEYDADGAIAFMRRVGDLDGDALDDLAVVLLEEAVDGGDDGVGSTGDVTTIVRALASAELAPLWEVTEDTEPVVDIAPTEDRDDDGVPEILVGRSGAGEPGFIAIWSGSDGAEVLALPPPPAAAGSFPGHVRDAGADLDDDGVRDLFVADAMGTTDCFTCGAVWAVSGADGDVVWDLAGNAGQLLGNTLEVADLDGNGSNEILIGDFYHSVDVGGGVTPVVGDVRVLEGGSGALRWHFEGIANEHDSLGIAVGAIGDLDGDGVSEVGAAAYYPPVDLIFGPPARLVVLDGADGDRIAQVRDVVDDPLTQLSTMLGAGLAPLGDGRFAASAPRTTCEGDEGYLASWTCTP